MDTQKTLNYEETKHKALKYLEYRNHFEQELKVKLKRVGATDENIEKVMEFLREYNFVNDREMSVRYAKDLKNLKKFGKQRVRTELIKKGLSCEIAENAISELSWEDDDVLYEMIKKKLGGNLERKNIDKAIRYFLYKGYSYDEIKRALDRIKAEEY